VAPAFDDISCPAPAFQSFRYTVEHGPCPPSSDCSGFTELGASGLLRHDCVGRLPPMVYEAMVSAADRDAAIAVLTDPALIAALDLGKPPCQPPTDLFETMILVAGDRMHGNSVTGCMQPPIAAARAMLDKLVQKYLAGRCGIP
jgi:hypothetical protein